MRHGKSELLELLNQRFKELDLGDGKPYRVPRWSSENRNTHERAARVYAEANRSDPFALGRMRLHLARGIENANEVIRDSHAALSARSRGLVPQPMELAA